MRRWLLALCLLVPAVGAAQGPVSVTASWDAPLATSPAHPVTAYELERDGVVHACAPLTETSCRAQVPAITGTYRLRGLNDLGAGPWSEPGSGGGAVPGAVTIIQHHFTPAQVPTMAATVETFAAPAVTDWTASGGTQNFTVAGGSGANRVMYIYAVWRYDRGHTLSYTFNGVSATKLNVEQTNPLDSTRTKGELWRLIAPASGNNTLAITASSGSGTAYCSVHVVVVQDADQTTPNDTVVHEGESGSDAATTQDVSVSSQTDDLVLMFAHFMTNGSGTTGSVSGSSYTLHQQTLNAGPGTRMITGSAAGATTVTPATTYNNSAASWGALRLGVNINAAAAAGGGRHAALCLVGCG